MQDEDKRRFYVEMMDAARLEAERELKKKKRDQVCSMRASMPLVHSSVWCLVGTHMAPRDGILFQWRRLPCPSTEGCSRFGQGIDGNVLNRIVFGQREKTKANKKVSTKDVNALRNAFLGGGRPAKRKKEAEEDEVTFAKADEDEFSQVMVGVWPWRGCLVYSLFSRICTGSVWSVTGPGCRSVWTLFVLIGCIHWSGRRITTPW